MSTTSLLLATVGPQMHIFAADVGAATLERIGGLTLPSFVHYGWPSADNRRLYVASSNGDGQLAGDNHYLTVLAVDPQSSTLRQLGAPAPLRSRPVHLCLDPQGRHVLVGYHYPAGLSVHRIGSDGAITDEIPQDPKLDTGIYPHQILAAPSGRQVLLVTRGNNPTSNKPEDPGALKLFDFVEGRLTFKCSVAPNGGYGFGPRDADFHPSLPLIYVSLERQRKLNAFRYENGALSPEPVFTRETLKEPGHIIQKQSVGAMHLHPKGHTVYVANRGGPKNPEDLHVGGENSIAVFRLDPLTGEPTAVQHVDSRGARPRTFGIDASGQMFWTASLQQRLSEEGGRRRVLPAGIATFHAKPDGTLEYAHRYDIDTSTAPLWWSGILTYDS
jgi:6-phosphogluconolactonase (cycloisomerase 2 family)